ncbi:hypothetical protein [Tengunoibacter tsumagoiensis]|uniref:Uncharacterized protein n=1 Tax=Tengunoibacter tsumagoiensis TaxID=2014871 RepID=A0A402A479_9CHLR|nr:hypothetical protein [Tengunoibacter tsumagoiensis]GCE13879.1 hypothetical protein KTT_37380 [Tengunoibacter tsumagoiensis]
MSFVHGKQKQAFLILISGLLLILSLSAFSYPKQVQPTGNVRSAHSGVKVTQGHDVWIHLTRQDPNQVASIQLSVKKGTSAPNLSAIGYSSNSSLCYYNANISATYHNGFNMLVAEYDLYFDFCYDGENITYFSSTRVKTYAAFLFSMNNKGSGTTNYGPWGNGHGSYYEGNAVASVNGYLELDVFSDGTVSGWGNV